MSEGEEEEQQQHSRFATFLTLPPDEEIVKLRSSDLVGNFLAAPGDLEHIVKNRIWLIADTHFRHRNILKYEPDARPFSSIEEMDNALIQRWNERVMPEDIVLHLGDFAFAGSTFIKDTLPRLKGHKYLLMGNHDRGRTSEFWLDAGFERVFDRPILLDDRFVLSHEPLAEIPPGKVNIYGHVHSSPHFSTFEPHRLCVCVERWDCHPIEYDAALRGIYAA